MTFAEIENTIGGALPASARKHAAFWSNSSSYARAWTDAGFMISRRGLPAEHVRFVRVATGDALALGGGARTSGDRRRTRTWLVALVVGFAGAGVVAAGAVLGDEPPPLTADPGASGATPERVSTTVVDVLLPYSQITVDDPALAIGEQRVRTDGVPGLRTVTFRESRSNGVLTHRLEVSDVVKTRAIAEVTARGTKTFEPPPPLDDGCHPSYDGTCLPFASDVDCSGGEGNGPAYARGPFQVVGWDVYDLDRDRDGIACE